MRKAGFLVPGLFLLLLFLLPCTSRAQETPSAEASVGYSYFRLGGSGGANLNGVSGSVAYNVNNWIGGVADLGFYHGSPSGVSLNNFSFLFGPRFSYRENSRFTPFGQALFGGSYLRTSASTTPFAWSFGGGVDYSLNDRIILRPQADYVGLRVNGTTTNCARVSVGLVFRFGRR